MSSEVLRRAASVMRGLAYAAAPSPWHHDPEAVMGNVRCAPHPGDDETLMVADTLADRDARHIASWHPAVALAVADWLDVVAEWELINSLVSDRFVGPTADAAKHALTVANAYLGESDQ